MHAGKISFQEMKSYILIAISLILASSALAADPSANSAWVMGPTR